MVSKARAARPGQLMLISLMILAGVFAIGFAVSTVFITEVKLSRQVLDSAKAVYAAESGLEWRLFQYFVSPTSTPPVMQNDTTFTSQIVLGPATTARAIGISNKVRRGLQVLIPL